MKRRIWWLTILLVWAVITQAMASEITIWDNQARNNGQQNRWQDNLPGEEEVEPAASVDSTRDMEGIFYENGVLSIVGEWNFLGTIDDISPGDIFISTAGYPAYEANLPSEPAHLTQTGSTLLNTYGYNYVFDVDWGNFANQTGSYTFRQIGTTTAINAAGRENSLNEESTLSFAYGGVEGLATSSLPLSTVQQSEFERGAHYMASGFDLSPIAEQDSIVVHFTRECGDNAIVRQIPEPATMLLLGVGLLGIGTIGRRLPLKSA